jgi:hypothetical protein
VRQARGSVNGPRHKIAEMIWEYVIGQVLMPIEERVEKTFDKESSARRATSDGVSEEQARNH